MIKSTNISSFWFLKLLMFDGILELLSFAGRKIRRLFWIAVIVIIILMESSFFITEIVIFSMLGVILSACLRWGERIIIVFRWIQDIGGFHRLCRWIKVKSLRRELLFSLIVEYFLREIKDTIPVRRLCHRLCLLCRVCLVLRSRRLKVWMRKLKLSVSPKRFRLFWSTTDVQFLIAAGIISRWIHRMTLLLLLLLVWISLLRLHEYLLVWLDYAIEMCRLKCRLIYERTLLESSVRALAWFSRSFTLLWFQELLE